MENILKGKVIVLGNNIDTDQIYPGRYLELVDPKEIGAHCLAGVDENIAPNFKEGDIVVAGTNFGCGSSREHAPISLLNMGASCVLADSFARIFFRNSINLGLPLIVCKAIAHELEDGDEIEVNILEGSIKILNKDKTLIGEKIGDYTMSILQAGGIKPLFRDRSK